MILGEVDHEEQQRFSLARRGYRGDSRRDPLLHYYYRRLRSAIRDPWAYAVSSRRGRY